VFQVATGELRIANAGHLQPLLLVPGRHPRFIEAGTGVPLGGASRLVRDGPPFSTRSVRLPARAALVLYTDGLVEVKNRELDNGLDLLREGLRGTFTTAEEICDRALAIMNIDDDTQDDTTLLVLQRIGPQESR
jgi:serine phosphatase RsbU (regulator of sigma subunit)